MSEEEVQIKESKPYSKKGTYIKAHFIKGKKNLINQKYSRKPRRTKKEIEELGTREEEKKRLRQFKQKVPKTKQEKLATPRKKKGRTKKQKVKKTKQKKIDE